MDALFKTTLSFESTWKISFVKSRTSENTNWCPQILFRNYDYHLHYTKPWNFSPCRRYTDSV